MEIHIIFAKISWYLFFVIMVMRPLAYVISSELITRLLPYRKQLGVMCGFAAIAHVWVFLIDREMLSIYFHQSQFWSLKNFFGWGNIGLLFLLFPFLTSNRWSQKKLRSHWKIVQCFAYPAFAATAIHVAMATGEYAMYIILFSFWGILWTMARKKVRILG